MSNKEMWARIGLAWLFMFPGILFYFFMSQEQINIDHCIIGGGSAFVGLVIIWPAFKADLKRYYP